MESKRASRWTSIGDRPFRLEPTDFELCRLFAPGARMPWGYQYLPSSFVPPLLQRGQWAKKRLRMLCGRRYLRKPEQPRDNHRHLIYALGPCGAEQLTGAGLFAGMRQHKLAHELMRCMIAASFELSGLPLAIVPPVQQTADPDWHTFRAAGSPVIYVEADLDSEDLTSKNPQATTIKGKYETYLGLIKSGTIKDARILFYVVTAQRQRAMIELLKRTIDEHRYDHDLAEHFGFLVIPFDRFLSKLPPASPWAVQEDYLRAGFEPFTFATESRHADEQAEAHQRTHY